MSMQTMTVAEFHAALKSQDVPDRADLALICPLCGTVQSARDLIAAYQSTGRFVAVTESEARK